MKTLFVALLAFLLTSAAAGTAPTRECLSQAEAAKAYPGKFLKYREIGSSRCWFAGPTPDKSEFKIAPASAEPLDSRAVSEAQRVQAPPAERLRSNMGALRRDVDAATARPADTADDLVGLAGTLCPGPLRGPAHDRPEGAEGAARGCSSGVR